MVRQRSTGTRGAGTNPAITRVPARRRVALMASALLALGATGASVLPAGAQAATGTVRSRSVADVPPIVMDPSEVGITPGGRAVLRVRLSRPDSRAITFNLAGLPVGSRVAMRGRSSRERQIVVDVPGTTRPGRYLVRIDTVNPGTVRSAAVTLVVTGAGVLEPGQPIAPPTPAPTAPTPVVVPPSVAPVPTLAPLVVPPTSSETIVMGVASGGVVVAGGSAPVGEVEAVVLNGTGPAALVADGLPAGLVVTFPGAANGRTPIVASAAAGTPAGTYSFRIIARSDRVTTSIGAALRVVDAAPSGLRYPVVPVAAAPGEQQGFGIAANSATPTVGRGQSVQVLVTITPRGGFARPVDLSLAGFPSGVTARLAATNLANVVALEITVPPGQSVGSYPFQIAGSSEGLRAAISLTLNVT